MRELTWLELQGSREQSRSEIAPNFINKHSIKGPLRHFFSGYIQAAKQVQSLFVLGLRRKEGAGGWRAVTAEAWKKGLTW
jgi:hypothetical protein